MTSERNEFLSLQGCLQRPNWYLTDFPPSQNSAQVYFNMRSHAWIETHEWPEQRILGSVGILRLGPFRRQAINSALQVMAPRDQADVMKCSIPPTRGAPMRMAYCTRLSLHLSACRWRSHWSLPSMLVAFRAKGVAYHLGTHVSNREQ